MGALRVGATLRHPPLAGKWSVWSASSEAPGAYFLIPADVEARAMGLKYAVVRVVQPRSSAFPEISILRTDPPRPDLTPIKEKKR